MIIQTSCVRQKKVYSFKLIGIGDKTFDDEGNRVFLRERLHALSKEMKRDHSKKMYNHRSKVATIFYVVNKTMLDDIG